MSRVGHGHEDFEDCDAIVRGAVHEMEHTDDWATAMDIAADHLREREDYYDVLEEAMGEGEMRPNKVSLSDQQWRCWYDQEEWEVVPFGQTHAHLAEAIVRRDSARLREYKRWNKEKFHQYEEYLLEHGYLKQWGLMFFTGPKPPWGQVRVIQGRVLEMQPEPTEPVDVYFGYEKSSPGYELSVDDFVNAKSFRDIRAASEAWEMRPNGPEALLLPIAIELATTFPEETASILHYGAMIAFPPYGLARLAWGAGKWGRDRAKRAMGYKENGIFAAGLRRAAPAMKPVVKNLLKWLTGAYRLALAGAKKVDIVTWLRENKIAAKLANAIADAVINVAAQEAGEAVRAGGRSIRARVAGSPRTVEMPPAEVAANPGAYYVWAMVPRSKRMEGPWGPYHYQNARTYARIAATKGSADRVVTRGMDPETLTIKRIYEAGTGAHLYTDEDG